MIEQGSQFSLVNSILSGFTAGIAVSIVVGAYAKISRCLLRRDQIRYIRKVLLDGIDKITSAEAVGTIPTPVPGVSISPDQQRHLHYRRMWRMLEATIQNRSSEIRFEEIMELTEAFYTVNWLIDDNEKLAPKKEYDAAFAVVKTIKWLNIKK